MVSLVLLLGVSVVYWNRIKSILQKKNPLNILEIGELKVTTQNYLKSIHDYGVKII